jgi:hypothetical protein
MRRNPKIYSIPVVANGRPDADVRVLEPKFWVDVRCNLVVGTDDLLEINVDKIVERVDVLFDQTFCLKECWQEFPFVLECEEV